MTPGDRDRERTLATLRMRIHAYERELQRLRDEVRGVERRASFQLHHGRSIPAPTCAACGGAKMSWFARSGGFLCHRCGSAAPRQVG